MFEPPGIGVIRTVIADQDALARERLRLALERMETFDVVAECGDGRATIVAVCSLRPDLLLLDVEMPDCESFRVLNEIDADPLPITVFTAAHDQYAMRAFESNALDYLLKPIDDERLRRTLSKVRNELEKERARTLARHMLGLFTDEHNPTTSRMNDRLVITSGKKTIFLDLDDVDWVKAAGNYVQFYVGKDSYTVRAHIGRVLARLSQRQFARIHRSTIVNISKIKELQRRDSGGYTVLLKNGNKLPCSRSYRESLRQFVDEV